MKDPALIDEPISISPNDAPDDPDVTEAAADDATEQVATEEPVQDASTEPFSDDEWVIMREHTTAGERILSDKPFFSRARKIARSHHENFDGTGYPDKHGGDEIPIEARIVHVADVYDALTNPRVYKPAWPREKAMEFISASSGRMFDPQVTAAFASVGKSG